LLSQPPDFGRWRLSLHQFEADGGSVSWASLFAVVVLSWLGIALVVGTMVGFGIAFGTGTDFE
jgi:hypothetical protein